MGWRKLLDKKELLSLLPSSRRDLMRLESRRIPRKVNASPKVRLWKSTRLMELFTNISLVHHDLTDDRLVQLVPGADEIPTAQLIKKCYRIRRGRCR